MTTELLYELAEVRGRRQTTKRQRRYKSRLDQFRAELVALRSAGATIGDLVAWLRIHRCRVAGSTVWRYLRKLSEMRRGDAKLS
ncbi:hypothetical protein [Citrifermentans bremense]|uniref:hypothetical protein n=1 Tax=Citrifermentans bremense TaxID=60035 RepID=UPI00047D5060|nr:hypothetical protein [Citrifermentans bremense]